MCVRVKKKTEQELHVEKGRILEGELDEKKTFQNSSNSCHGDTISKEGDNIKYGIVVISSRTKDMVEMG